MATKKKPYKHPLDEEENTTPTPEEESADTTEPEATAEPEEERVVTTAEQEAKLIEKLNKLLVITKENGATDAEAESALLKAQKLMHKYNIAMEKLGGEEKIEYGLEKMDHIIKASPRWPLSNIIAKSFACRPIQTNGYIAFLGHKMDAKAALEAFKFAWTVLKVNGQALQRERKGEGGSAQLVFNTYANGFLSGLETKLNEQTVALTIVVPTDVHEEFDRMFPNVQKGKTRMRGVADPEAYARGFKDGKSVLGQRELSA